MKQKVAIGCVLTTLLMIFCGAGFAIYYFIFDKNNNDNNNNENYVQTITSSPTLQPTSQVSIVLNEVTSLLNNTEAITKINTILSDQTERMSSVLSASVIHQMIKITPPSISCEIGNINYNSINCTKYREELRIVSEKMQKSRECAYYISKNNITQSDNIMLTSLYASIQSENDFLQYFNLMKSIQNNVDSSSAIIFREKSNSTNSNSDDIDNLFAVSCDVLISLQLNRTMSIFSSTDSTRRYLKYKNLHINNLENTDVEADDDNDDDDNDDNYDDDDDDDNTNDNSSCDIETDPTLYIYYINGMNCDEKCQSNGFSVISQLLKTESFKTLFNTEVENLRVSIDKISNPSEGFLYDLAECLFLQFDEVNTRYDGFMYALTRQLKQSVVNLFSNDITDYEWDDFLNFYYDHLNEKMSEYSINQVSNNIKNKVKDAIAHGDVVILIPHSQGNFYTNIAYQGLTSTEKLSVRIVSLANPAAYVGVQNNIQYYSTRYDDKVIKYIPTSLATNINNPSRHYECSNSTLNKFLENPVNVIQTCLNHNFVEAYVQDTSVWNNYILPNIRTSVGRLTFPNMILKSGLITVTLTWSANNPDVDLHVYEPSGLHVYYSHRRGNVGELDHDDTNGSGPENYVVDKCSNKTIGTYYVGVNYYSGYTPETAEILIRAGNQRSTFYKYLSESRGSSGNSNPYLIAKIIYDPSNILIPFQIIGI